MELSDCCGNCKTKNKQKKKTEKTGIKVSMKICKALVKSHLHYGGVIQDKAKTKHFTGNLNLFNVMPGLGIPPTTTLVQWIFFLFYKIYKDSKLVQLFNLILTKNSNYNTRNTDQINLFHTKHNCFKISFSLLLNGTSQIITYRSPATQCFQKNLFKFIRPYPNSVF